MFLNQKRNVIMMSLLFLTIFLCVSNADVYINLGDISYEQNNYAEIQPYNIHQWIQYLQLQTCALVAIGQKYFAIFVENITVSHNATLKSIKYFLGICHQSTLENWDLCSPNLAKKRKHKCQFKLKAGVYQPRVHRRFCDLKIILNNEDCLCETTVGGEKMFKIRGFPACYIPPLPQSLCKYNVCGLSSCEGLTENSVHTIQCDPKCTHGNPFCEGPVHRTSRPPEINSLWSKWSRELENATDGESPTSTMKTKGKNHRSLATCINKYTRKPDLDCLGPGTACCPRNVKLCFCKTFEDNEGLKLERTIYGEDDENTIIKRQLPKAFYRFPFRRKKYIKPNYRFLRDTENDIEDDEDENNDDLGEDIVLEEDTEPIPLGRTTVCEPCEKGEVNEEVENSIAAKKLKASKNNTLTNLRLNSKMCINTPRIEMLIVIILFTLITFL